MDVIVFIDGSCLGNPGPMGWAVKFMDGRIIVGRYHTGTNNRAELYAAITAVQASPTLENVRIISDSTYVVSPWSNIEAFLKKVKINRDLWLRLYEETQGKHITFQWAPRNSTPELKTCDSMAKVYASCILS